jgi:hypothetical protein
VGIEEECQEHQLFLYANETIRPDEIDRMLLQEMPCALKLKREDL